MSAMQVLDCLKKLKIGILMERLVAFDLLVNIFMQLHFDFSTPPSFGSGMTILQSWLWVS